MQIFIKEFTTKLYGYKRQDIDKHFYSKDTFICVWHRSTFYFAKLNADLQTSAFVTLVFIALLRAGPEPWSAHHQGSLFSPGRPLHQKRCFRLSHASVT